MADQHLDHLGVTRRLDYVPPVDGMLRAARTNIQTIRQTAGLPGLIPKEQWMEVNYLDPKNFPESLFEDQGHEGACTCATATGAGSRQRYIRTGQVVKTSWQWLYDQINGGRDAGSNIIESMGVVESQGTPPADSYTKSLFKANRNPSGVEWFKEDVPVTLSDSDECATALLMGMFPQVPILVTSNFESWTSQGIAWGGSAPRSNRSNHSIYLAGLKQIGGDWVFMLANSWSENWGPFKQGWCYIPFAAIDNPSTADDGYAHASTPSASAIAPGATA